MVTVVVLVEGGGGVVEVEVEVELVVGGTMMVVVLVEEVGIGVEVVVVVEVGGGAAGATTTVVVTTGMGVEVLVDVGVALVGMMTTTAVELNAPRLKMSVDKDGLISKGVVGLVLTANVHACETWYATSASLSAGTGCITGTTIRDCSRTCQALSTAAHIAQSGVGDDLALFTSCATAV